MVDLFAKGEQPYLLSNIRADLSICSKVSLNCDFQAILPVLRKNAPFLVFLFVLVIIALILRHIIFYPFYLPFRKLSSNEKPWKKVVTICYSLFILIPIWFVGFLSIIFIGLNGSRIIGEQLGLVRQESLIAGTGSMYPTFPKGSSKTVLAQMSEVAGRAKARIYPGGFIFRGRRHFGYDLQRGDIVFFSNNKTREIIFKESDGVFNQETGFVKRVVALPGDTIEIRDGFVKLNGAILSESYTASPRSTYGGDFLPDCQLLAIPSDHVFVMGDNRKGSNDSRFDVGVVGFSDIKRVIPINEQDDLKANWRNTSHDQDTANKPTLDPVKFLEELNKKRAEEGLPQLKYQEKLAKSASFRADAILRYDDFSYEATRSGYTMEKAMGDALYSNIVWGEAPTRGYFDALELIENSFQFPARKKFLLNKDFQETGISVKVGTINGCPVQVVVQHLAGYIPPNYKAEDIQALKTSINRLKEVQPSWEDLKKFDKFYSDNKADIDKITAVINQRINGLSVILSRMEANLWLSDTEKSLLDADKGLYEEQEQLADKINSK